MTRLSLENYEIRPIDHENFISGRTGNIVVEGQEIGFLGELHPATLEQYELKNPTAALEIDISKASSLIH